MPAALPSSPPVPTKPTVVLACASEDASAMTKVLRRLVERGVRVDVVAGVELDVRPFEDAVARGTSRTVYVLCRSDDLDAFQVDRLRTVARNAKITTDRVVLVPFDPELPIDFAETLLRQLAETGRVVRRVTRELPPVPEVGPRRSTCVDLRLVGPAPTLARAPAAIAKPTIAPPVAAARAPISKRGAAPMRSATKESPAPGQPLPTLKAPPAAAKPMPARVIAAPIVGAPILAPPTVGHASGVPSSVAIDESFVRLVLDAVPANVVAEPTVLEDEIAAPASAVAVPTVLEDAITNVIPLDGDPTAKIELRLPIEPAPPVTVETAVTLAELQSPPLAAWPSTPAPTVPAPEPSTASLTLSDGLGESFAPLGRFSAKRIGVGLAIAASVLATIVAVSRRDDGSRAAVPELAAATSPIEVTRREPARAPTIDAPTGPQAATHGPPNSLIAALEARTIRALDGLFVSRPKPAMRRGAATAHCRGLVIAGLRNWRLPTADEIALLGEAGFVADASTWWRGGKKVRRPRVEWTGKRVREHAATKRAAAGAFCVHAVGSSSRR